MSQFLKKNSPRNTVNPTQIGEHEAEKGTGDFTQQNSTPNNSPVNNGASGESPHEVSMVFGR